MSKITSLALVAILGLSGCVTQPTQQKSSLELQAIQAKEFETTHKIAFTATLSVFQDLGYIIKTASLETGLVTAKSPTTQRFVPFVGRVMNEENASAFVEQVGPNRTRIRLSFVNNVQTSGGGMTGQRDTPIQDPIPYQNAFAKIQQSIFVRSNLN